MANSNRSYRHSETVVPGGVGVGERQVHAASGLRTASLTAMLTLNVNAITPAPVSIGTVGGTDPVLDWTSIKNPATWQPRLPVPITPLLYLFTLPAGAAPPFSMRFRLTGYDQFGARKVEVTPWHEVAVWAVNNYAFMLTASQVFSYLDNVEYQCTRLDITLSRLSVGYHTMPDHTRLEASAGIDPGNGATSFRTLGTFANWGLGIPMRVEPYGPDMPYRVPEILGATAVLLRNRTNPANTVRNVIARLPVFGDVGVGNTGLAIGHNATGYRGEPHKIGFRSSDSWATKIPGIELGGSEGDADDIPDSLLEIGDDEILWSFQFRSTAGTLRQANPTNSYRPT
ncbi:MAG TPA: hypothetical protein VFM38_00945 [Candidatus Limnocylindrales bacterium]|nr:hypothetical protein [Candidatus Limnocylindrales bacterium]